MISFDPFAPARATVLSLIDRSPIACDDDDDDDDDDESYYRVNNDAGIPGSKSEAARGD